MHDWQRNLTDSRTLIMSLYRAFDNTEKRDLCNETIYIVVSDNSEKMFYMSLVQRKHCARYLRGPADLYLANALKLLTI